ncbi:nucleotidyltransferase domain-containing protein [Armatimonas sp.]|uniref:nucleotidyltransferase domain-containing protein n=1 Tax=Armatimonas sp. TaxID=1872638 RepID=UPI00286B1C63|nr:nucleotidyltransferase domain-containing protein [Armatimonas sp.]
MQLDKIISERHWPHTTLFIPFGSRVYGTARPDSDDDYLVVFPENDGPSGLELALENTNLQIFTLVEYQTALDAHQIHALEAYFVPNSPLSALCSFTLNRATLRQALSQKASHSFVKAKKKIAVEQDYLPGWKSLFHSLRILVFGIELARTGALTNFAAANAYWDEIWAAQETDWETLKTRWQPVHNALSSEFRKLAPKE